MNVLGIGLDYLMLGKDKVRGDVALRQLDYAKHLGSLTLVIYSPSHLNLKPIQWADNLWIYPTNSINKNMFIIDALRIASKICRDTNIDVITTEDPFVTGLVGWVLKSRYNIPLNVQAHIDFFDNTYWQSLRFINKVFNRLGKFICKNATTVRVVARETKESLERYGIPPEKVKLLSVHSDLRHFRQKADASIRRQYLNNRFDHMLLFVGRLVDQKDIPNLFSAFALILKKMPKTVLILIGHGPKKTDLEMLARKMGIDSNIVLTGSVDHSVIQKYYSACDVFVLPSIFEGRATVIVEAILSKKPIVSTDVSGLREWILDGETGFIVKRKDPESFADKVLYFLQNPDIAKIFGEKGHKIAQTKIEEIGDITSMIKLWAATASTKIIDPNWSSGGATSDK
ncbi:glycosyltransferase family 4 protein [Candidatus Omnitrophota bacterium]